MDLNTNLTTVVDHTQTEIERVLAELQDLKAEMKRKADERDDLAKSHRNQQIVRSKWLEVLQQVEMCLAQACSAFNSSEVLTTQMRSDVDIIFQRVTDNFEEYSQTEIKETDAIVEGKLIKGAWNPKEYVAQITGGVVNEDADDVWGEVEAEVIEPSITKQAVKMFLIDHDGEDDSELWSYLQESVGIVNKKRTLDTVATAIAVENATLEELEEYYEEYRKKVERKQRRQKGQGVSLKAV